MEEKKAIFNKIEDLLSELEEYLGMISEESGDEYDGMLLSAYVHMQDLHEDLEAIEYYDENKDEEE